MTDNIDYNDAVMDVIVKSVAGHEDPCDVILEKQEVLDDRSLKPDTGRSEGGAE